MSKIIILSGAGISAESGISTFRDNGGLWDEYDVNVVCNYDSLKKNEKLTLEFYDKRRADLKHKKPNHAHNILAKLKQKYPDDIALITQNVDDLFEKTTLTRDDVLHLHGFLTEVSCRNPRCSTIYDIGYNKIYNFNDGRCLECNSRLRPNIVFFGERAPEYEKLYKAFAECEMFVVIGTSGAVIQTDSFLNAKIKRSILNNLEPSDSINDKRYSKVLFKPASEAIDEIAMDIEDFLTQGI
ncbi:MAG: NAD-dependent deacetylase [Sulfurimonas sp.]|nr:NAD-dependent deacetylase [Sulfurimonas sp.]MDD5202212.1 NAD-dependent deacetylase [Sulfurimonas sp.]